MATMTTCPVCATPHQRRGIYCSQRCKKRADNARQRGTPLRRFDSYDCAYCGKHCVPGVNVHGAACRFCGVPCKKAWHHVHVDGQAWRPITRRQKAEVKLAQARAGTTSERAWTMGWCVVCGQPFVTTDHRATSCSRHCQLRVKARRHKAAGRDYAQAIKLERGCADCGCKPDDPEELHFHHSDPSEKIAGVSALYSQHDKLRAEIAKCIVLCPSCHRARHPEVWAAA